MRVETPLVGAAGDFCGERGVVVFLNIVWILFLKNVKKGCLLWCILNVHRDVKRKESGNELFGIYTRYY